MGFRIHPAWWFFGLPGLILAGLVAMLFGPNLGAKKSENGPLVVQCAAGLRVPVEAIAKEYERETGQRVEVQYGGSQMLLSSIKTTGVGDLFLPADDSYINDARKDGLIAEVNEVARMSAVLAVAAGNPKRIASWSDLLNGDAKLAQAEPDVAAIGRLTRDHLSKSGQWDAVQRKTTVTKTTVNDVANSVVLGGVDAGIVWDAVARVQPKLAMVALPGLSDITARVQVAVLATSKQPAAANRFAHFLTKPEKGLKQFRAHGFVDVEDGEGKK